MWTKLFHNQAIEREFHQRTEEQCQDYNWRRKFRSAGKLWNNTPKEIKETTTLVTAKRLTKAYCKTMPI